jgi:signal transduction histidine kinase
MASDTSRLVMGVLYLVPTLVWAVLCERSWYFTRTRHPRSWQLRLMPLAMGCLAVHMALVALLWLLPSTLHTQRPEGLLLLYVANAATLIAGLSLFRHALLPLGTRLPGRSWLAANYLPGAAIVALGLAAPRLIPDWTGPISERVIFLYGALVQVYVVVTLALIVLQVARRVRRGTWGPAAFHEARRLDVMIIGPLLVATTLFLVALLRSGRIQAPATWAGLLDVAVNLVVALPIAVRLLGEVVRGVTVGMAALAGAGGVYLGANALAAHVDPGLRPLLDVATVVVLAVVLVPGQRRVRAWVERVMFGRTLRRQAELQAFLHTLSPEIGALECCRRALGEFARVMGLRGAAVLFAHGEGTVVEGSLTVAPLERVWPRDPAADARLARAFGLLEMVELPAELREALAAAEVMGVFPIMSPRRFRGHLFMTAGPLGTIITDEDGQAMSRFTDQLALLLDGAELLAHAVSVERSLAHAEKLAAIGELTARIAHEIRNPVTAARSLAQQLRREPGAAFREEHELILSELARVERQVAELLRFARREEFRFEPVDLGELAGATVEQLRPRLEAAGVEVEAMVDRGVRARADREKLRQVLINLIENAIDALAGSRNGRRTLDVTVGAADGSATLRVSDNGPGVAPEVLPHLFEPFFSQKPQGTGLGLAIVKRTVDAHGGHIAATGVPGGGLAFDIALPLAGVA